MSTTDDRQPKQAPDPDYPFIDDARIDGLRDTYMGLRSFGQGMAIETLAEKAGSLQEDRPVPHQADEGRGRAGGREAVPGWAPEDENRYLFPTPKWWVEEKCHLRLRVVTTPQKARSVRGATVKARSGGVQLQKARSEGVQRRRGGVSLRHHKRSGQEGCNALLNKQ